MRRRTSKMIPAVGAILIALLGLLSLLSLTAYAAEPAMLTVRQVCAQADAAFSYRLVPQSPSCPLPPGSGPEGYVFAITGTDAINVGPIRFTQAGVYAYELRPVQSCACALETYALKIYVEPNLETTVVAVKPDGAKAVDIQFAHSCGEAPPPTTEPATTPETTKPAGGGGPDTGDESKPGLYISMFCASGVALLGCAGYLLLAGRRRKKDK